MGKLKFSRWINVSTRKLDSKEYLQEEYLHSGYSKVHFNTEHGGIVLGNVVPKTAKWTDIEGIALEESDQLADAAAVFSSENTDLCSRVKFNQERLVFGLEQQCQVTNSFTTVLQLKLHILKCMHESLQDVYKDHEMICERAVPMLNMLFREKHVEDVNTSTKIDFEAQLGIELFFTILEGVLKEKDKDLLIELLDLLVEMMVDWPALALSPEKIQGLAIKGGNMHEPVLLSSIKNDQELLARIGLGFVASRYSKWRGKGIECHRGWKNGLQLEPMIVGLQELLENCIHSHQENRNASGSKKELHHGLSTALTCMMFLAHARGSLTDFLKVAYTMLDISLPLGENEHSSYLGKQIVDEQAQQQMRLSETTVLAEDDDLIIASPGMKTKSKKQTKCRADDDSNSIDDGDREFNEEASNVSDSPKKNMQQIDTIHVRHASILLDNEFPLEHLQKSKDTKDTLVLKANVEPVLQALVDAKAAVSPLCLDAGSTDREIWTCGQNSYGELAHDDTIARTTLNVVKLMHGKEMMQVRAGNEHTVVLTSDGIVYTAGYNDNGQCGQGTAARVSQLTPIDALRGKVVSQIHAYNGCEHTLVVTEEGHLYTFGYNYRGQLGHGTPNGEVLPKLVQCLERKRVSQVACSYYHSIVACESGEVFSFGRNDYGQLGLGDTLDRKLPGLIEVATPSLARQRIVSLSCGQYHTVMVADSGTVYSFGKNDYGQLGLESPENQKIPIGLPASEMKKCIQACCGYYHTILMYRIHATKSNILCGFGRNDYGQLGLGHNNQRVYGQQRIADLEGKSIASVATGCYHTIAASDNGLLFVFGRNNHGQLGTGDTEERHSPFVLDTFVGKRISGIAGGFYHTVILIGGNEPQEDEFDEEILHQGHSAAQRWPTNVLDLPNQTQYVAQQPSVDLEPSENLPESQSLTSGLPILDIATFIIAHLDRLVSAYVPSDGRYPILNVSNNLRSALQEGNGTIQKDSFVQLLFPGSKQPYCIDVCADTLSLLLQLVTRVLYSHDPFNTTNSAPNAYRILLATYRLIQANLAQILRSGIGMFLEDSSFIVDDSSEAYLDVKQHIPAIKHQLEKLKRMLLTVIHDKTIIILQLQKRKASPDDEDQNLKQSSPNKDIELAENEAILQGAIKTFMTGLELFYPCCHTLYDLFRQVIQNGADGQFSPFDTSNTELCEGEAAHLREISDPACSSLLKPLLARLADDYIISNMLVKSRVSCPVNSKLCEASKEPVVDMLTIIFDKVSEYSLKRVSDFQVSFACLASQHLNKLYLKLLLIIQKQLFSIYKAKKTRSSFSTGSLHSVEAAYIEFQSTLMQPKIPSGILQYSLSVLDHCKELLVVVSSEGAPPSPFRQRKVDSEPIEDATARAMDQILLSSMIGTVLPSLLHLLLLVADKAFVHSEIFDSTFALLMLFETLNPSSNFGASTKLQSEVVGREIEKSQNKSMNAHIDTCVSQKWCKNISNTLAMLCASLATHQVLGTSTQHSIELAEEKLFKSTGELQQRMKHWMKYPQFRLGAHELESKCNAQHGNNSPPQFYASFAGKEVRDFLDCFTSGNDVKTENGQAVSKWVTGLRDTFSKSSPNYKMALFQGRNTTDYSLMNSIEKALFGALLKHNSLVIDAYAVCMGSNAITVRYLNVWKDVANFRRWLLSQRNLIKSGDPQHCSDDGPVNFAGYCVEMLARLKFLFCLAHNKVEIKNCMPFNPACCHLYYLKFPYKNDSIVSSIGARYSAENNAFLKQYPKSKWRKVRSYIHVLFRWKRLTAETAKMSENRNSGNGNCSAETSFCIDFAKTAGTVETVEEDDNGSLWLLKGAVHLDYLVLHYTGQYAYAESRITGFNHFFELIKCSQNLATKCVIVESLAQAISLTSRSEHSLKGMLLRDIHAVGESTSSNVQHSFQKVFDSLGDLLLEVCSNGINFDIDESRNLVSSIYSCWTLKYCSRDMTFFAESDILGQVLNSMNNIIFEKKRKDSITKDTGFGGIKSKKTGDIALRTLRESAWRLFRYLCTHLTSSAINLSFKGSHPVLFPLYPLLSTVYGVLLQELHRGIDKMVQADGKILVAHQQNSGRRSHDLIAHSHQFLALERGFSISGNDSIVATKCNEFSLTMWIYLVQDATGSRRMVFLRGNKVERAPYVLLRAEDCRLEIGILVGDVVEKLTTKAAVPLKVWTHIATICDTNKLRVYINGILDCQRTNTMSPQTSVLPFHFGKFPPGLWSTADNESWDMENENPLTSGFDGSLGNVRYHNRALSAIHVHVVWDQGPPEPKNLLDRRCYELTSTLLPLAESGEGVQEMCSSRWILAYFRMLMVGTPRVQQIAIRILSAILPFTDPAVTDSTLTLSDICPTSDEVPLESFRPKNFMLKYLLRLIGICQWRANSKPSIADEATSSTNTRLHNFPSKLLNNLQPNSKLKSCSNTAATDEGHSLLIAADLSLLVRKLNQCCQWKNLLHEILSENLSSLGKVLDNRTENGIAQTQFVVHECALPQTTVQTFEGIGTLSVLGSLVDTYRIGAITEMQQPVLRGSLYAIESSNGANEVAANIIVATRKNDFQGGSSSMRDHCVERANVESWDRLMADATSIRPLKIKMDDLTIDSDQHCFRNSIFKTQLEQSFLTFTQQAVGDNDASSLGDEKSNVLLPIICKSQVLRVMLCIVQSAINHDMILSQKNILDALLTIGMAAHESFRDDFFTLNEVEAIVSMLRQRTYQTRNSKSSDSEYGPESTRMSANLQGLPKALQIHEPLVDVEEAPLREDENDDSEADGDGEENLCEPSPELVEDLMIMGFPEAWCILGLKERQNDFEGASNWIIDNLDMLSNMQMDRESNCGTARSMRSNGTYYGSDEEEEDSEDDMDDDFDGLNSQDELPMTSREQVAEDPNEGEAKCSEHPIFDIGPSHEDFASTGFAESYFTKENGSFGCNTISNRYFNGSPLAANLPHEGGEPSFKMRLRAMQTKIMEISSQDLYCLSKTWESYLASLYARCIILLFLQQLSKNNSNSLASNLLVAILMKEGAYQYFKSVSFRGDQFEQYLGVLPRNILAQAMKFRHTSNCGSDFDEKILPSILSDLSNAATADKLKVVNWGSRSLKKGERQAYDEPNVEAAYFYLSELLVVANNKDCAVMQTQTLESLCTLLATQNMPLKVIALKCICKWFCKWESLELGSSNDRTSTVVASLEKHFSLTALECEVELRRKKERQSGRLLYSRYIQVCLDAVLLVRNFMETAGMSNVKHEKVELNATIKPSKPRVQSKSLKSINISWDGTATEFVAEYCPLTNGNEFIECFRGPETNCTIRGVPPNVTFYFRVKDASNDSLDAWSDISIISTPSKIPFTFDPTASSRLKVSDNCLQATYQATESWSTVLCSDCFITGKNRWEIRIDKSSTSYMFLGVASKQVNKNCFLGGDEFGWGYIGDRALYHNRAKTRTYGDRFVQGDVVGITLDMDQGTLSYSKNGLDLGVAFDNLAGELYPAISFYNHHQKVSLLEKSFSCPGVGVSIDGSPSDIALDDIYACSKIIGFLFSVKSCKYKETQSFSNILRIVYSRHMKWLHREVNRMPTRAGYELELDTSKEALDSFGFQYNDRVRTARGEGTIVGALSGRLWAHLDDEPGAWFVLPDEVQHIENAKDIESIDDMYDCAEVDFINILRSNMCALQEFTILVRSINLYCDRKSVNPWNLRPKELLEIFKGCDRMEVLSSHDVLFPVYSLMCYFNHLLTKVIRYIDLSEVLDGETSLFNKSQPSQSLSSQLAAIRGCIFWTTKQSIISELLDRTATRPQKADDDYDYPEELPQILLNRPRAAAASCKEDPEVRLGASMFGQAFDELHFLDHHILRIGYSHPMDDGQERAFKAKFEGEGVDDYGGPYRECFSQFAAELQATRKAGSTIETVLPLLIPSPNWQHAMGQVRDKLIVAPKLTQKSDGNGTNPIYLEMYNFFGQLLGIAMRSKALTRFDFPELVWKALVGEELSWHDLEEIDSSVYSLICQLKSKSVDEAFLAELSFATTLSNGENVVLTGGNEDTLVCADNVGCFLTSLIHTRLYESEEELLAIRDGLLTVIPAAVLSLLCWHELELRICGRSGIDIDLLEANTEYDDDVSPDDFFIQSLWRVLRAFDENDKCAFLRFVWARTRLPLSSSEFHQKFKIQIAVGEGMTENPDNSLPKSHTCFFSLSIPKYTSDEATKRQILYAIHNCIEMDADFRLAEAEMTGWNEIQASDQLTIT